MHATCSNHYHVKSFHSVFFGHLQSGEIIHCVMNIVQNPQHFRTELRYKRQLCGESCGPGLVSMSPVSRKIFGAHVLLSGGVVSGLYTLLTKKIEKTLPHLMYTIVRESMGKLCSCMQQFNYYMSCESTTSHAKTHRVQVTHIRYCKSCSLQLNVQ